MFSQRKSFLKGKLFYIILLALFAFGIWLNQTPALQESKGDVKAGTDYPVTSDGALKHGVNGNDDIMKNIISKNQTTTSGVTNNDNSSVKPDNAANIGYYLVKEVGGIIKVFYYDMEGKESLIRETDIAFSLLSIADQALFQKGIIKHTQEELDELLQDFES